MNLSELSPFPFLEVIAGMMSHGLPFLKMRCLLYDCFIVNGRLHPLDIFFQEILI